MSFLRFIVIVSILWYNSQRHTIFGMNEDQIWFSIDPNEAFAYFIEHKNHVLDVEKISSFLVSSVTKCALRCVHHALCLSFNIKEDKTDNNTQMACELLPINLLNASMEFRKREEFHHWSFTVSKAYC